MSDDEGDIFYADIASDGSFALIVPPGKYVLRTDSKEIAVPITRVSGDAGDQRDAALEGSLRAPAPDAVVTWLKDKAMPIATSAIDGPTDDLEPLARALDDARVIGAGEATHGTRELFQIKHRLFEHLVAKHGVTIFAMEANFAGGERIDEYIRTGRGDPDDILDNLFSVWKTEEIRDLIAWMRRYNADPKHRRKIRFRGYDVQGARGSIDAVRAYLRRADPRGEDLLRPLAPLDAQTNSHGTVELTDGEKTATRDAAARLVDFFVAQKKTLVARSNDADYALAARHAVVIQQAQALFAAAPKEEFALRDGAMADNIVWHLEHAEPAARMFVWAHNGHIQTDSSNLQGPNMGSRLRERLGTAYEPVGFVLNEGTYRAVPDRSDPRNWVEAPLQPIAPGFIAEAFARVNEPIFAVDLRAAPAGPVREWLLAPHLLLDCGWIVCSAERGASLVSLPRLFDVAVYVDHTTASRRLRRAP